MYQTRARRWNEAVPGATAEPVAERDRSEVEGDGDPLSVRTIRAVTELDDLSRDWERLAALSGRPMQDFAWCRACASAFVSGQNLRIVTVGTASRTTAIAPLVRQPERGGRLTLLSRLALLGVDELYEPMEFLFSDPGALTALAGAVARAGASLFLKRVPAESPIIQALRRAYRWRGLVVSRSVPGSPWIPLDAGWLQPEWQLTSGRRSAVLRARRMAEKMGPVQFELHCPGPDDVAPLLEEAFRVEGAGWKGRHGSAMTLDETRGIFYRQYAALAAEQGILRLCFLRIGGRAAAMQFAVEFGERFWLLKIGYDEAFARCSPGTLLAIETVRYAASQGLRSYEFLGTDEPWIQMWTPFVRPCVSVSTYPFNGNGMKMLASDATTVVRRKLSRFL